MLEENYEAAIVAFNKAIEISDKDAEVYLALGDAYIGVGDEGNALNAREKAISIDPMLIEAYLDIAKTYNDNKEYKKAIIILEEGYIVTNDKSIEKGLKEIKKSFYSFEVESAIEVSNNDSFESYGYYSNYSIKFKIPRVKDSVSNHEKINDKILQWTKYFYDVYNKGEFPENIKTSMNADNLQSWNIDYDAYQNGEVWALVLFEWVGIVEAGGIESYYILYYDSSIGDLITAEEYGRKCGYDGSAVIAENNRLARSDGNMTIEEANTLNDVMFYVDNTGKLEIVSDNSI